jgi:two-component system, NtrC family, sensor kinase
MSLNSSHAFLPTASDMPSSPDFAVSDDQSATFASLGQLAAGVAHEIGNPISYIFLNFSSLEKYLGQLLQILAAYENAEPYLSDSNTATRIDALRQEIDLEFLKLDIPALMAESRQGIDHLRRIMQDLKDFSRIDCPHEWEWANLHKGIDSTLHVVNDEIKHKALVVKEYAAGLPEIECLPSEINQVFLNLLVFAAHAIDSEGGTITIRTGVQHEEVWVEIEDTGVGIAPEDLPRIFDLFSTAKSVRKDTGLSLSLAYGIVKKHRGRLQVISERGAGTKFKLTLPVRRSITQAP